MVGFAPASAHSTLQAGHSKLLLTTLEEIIQLQIKDGVSLLGGKDIACRLPETCSKQSDCCKDAELLMKMMVAIRCRSSTYLEWSPNTNQLPEKCSKHKQKSVENYARKKCSQLEFPFSPLKMYLVFLLHLLKF
ncbi:hypothetical protein SEVIR_7G314300v4 [Setaria viridis]|uniref:Uncharacterized protein n=1 Tax=Setaria viridis TaxID=4556 RepID=A0A4U6U072_SETVI|nr:hypothetical protein SEVIR_7G314300v2 [Setaria viridis]TKW07546.1 hypothetical protein SEVIR_7G314300v2 [Setaria viridis]TKW07547.1 hypothetical protein SEVIR_7G314300v2 [Setaria viridis]